MQLTLLTALGLLLVLEGLMPLLLPQAWRDTFRRIMALKDGQLRFMGLMSVLLGLVLILLSK
jgi:uncharacterized protein YjeT (DUF2065 family)